MPYQFNAALSFISNRGRAPVSFLTELLDWGATAPADIFAPNLVSCDAYAVIKSKLGTKTGNDVSSTPVYVWESLKHRRAAMLELMRVHAGLESSWDWGEGVDTMNKRSMANKTGEETGIFQVSFDSSYLGSPEGKNILRPFVKTHGIDTPEKFIIAMKRDHKLALEYYARLVRVSIQWAGPFLRHGIDSVYPYLKRDSMREIMQYLA